MTRRFRRIDLAILVLTGIGCLFAFRNIPRSGPYVFDEADYMSAGSRGIAANLLELPSMSIVTFVKIGLGIGIDPGKRTNLSEIVRGSKDITFLRHYHGPVYFYWLAAIGPLLRQNEFWMRASSLLIHFLTFAIVYVGALHLVDACPRIAALVASFLFLFSAAGLWTAALVTPHAAFAFFTTLTLVLFARFLQTGAVHWWYASAAGFALAFCSIEYAILLPVTFAICLYVFRNRVALTRAALLRSALVFFGTVLVVWPLGILKLSVIKSYCFIVYLTLMRKAAFGTDSALAVWRHRFEISPFEYSVVIVCVIAAAYAYRRLSSQHLLLPCLIYGGLMLLTTLRNTAPDGTYIVSIVPPFALVSGAVIAFFLRRIGCPARRAIVAVLILAIVLDGVRRLPASVAPNPAVPNLMAAMRRDGLDHASALVPFLWLPTLAYYFPAMQLHPYLPTDDAASILEKLRAGGYRSFVDDGTGHPGHGDDGDLAPRLTGLFPRVEPISSSHMTLYTR